ncbi:MAG TPA: hypothetical protein VGK19_10735 [Capsulimonadaceae bacterium]|jgi:hypothetical protein
MFKRNQYSLFAIGIAALLALLIALSTPGGRTSAETTLWPDINNGMNGGSAGHPLAQGHFMVSLHLQHIDLSTAQLKALSLDPYDIRGNELTNHDITRRILAAAKSGKCQIVEDVTLTGPNAMSCSFNYPGDPDNPFATTDYHPSIIRNLNVPQTTMTLPKGFAWTFTTTPHLFANGTFYIGSSITTAGGSAGGCNAWAADGEPILAADISASQLIRKDGRIVDSKTTGAHLVIVTVRRTK